MQLSHATPTRPVGCLRRLSRCLQVKKSEVNAEVSVNSKHQTMSGLAFPLTDDAIKACQAYQEGQTDYVQLSIDLAKEIVDKDRDHSAKYGGDADAVTVQELPQRVPENAPRYHLFRFKHTHEGDYLQSTST